MIKFEKFKSIYFTLGIIVFLSVSITISFHSIYTFQNIKEKTDENIKIELTQTVTSVQSSISSLIDSYSVNEYRNILKSLIQNKEILAIVIDDYNMAKVSGMENYITGFITLNGAVEDFNPESKIHENLIKKAYYNNKFEIKNTQNNTIGTISFYISDEILHKELEEIIYQSIINTFLLSFLLITVLFLAIYYFIVRRISLIVKSISKRNDEGIPLNEINLEGPSEILFLIKTINKMIKTIKTSRDELQRYYEAIQEERDMFNLAIDATKDGLWDWNLMNDEVYFSSNWKAMLGYKDEEIKNTLSSWSDGIHPDDKEQAFIDVKNHLEGRTAVYENEHRMKHKDGHWIWILDRGKALFDKDGKAYRMVGFHTDVTEHHQLIDAMKSEKLKYKSLMELSSDAIFIMDEMGNLTEYSTQAKRLLGYSDEEMKEITVFDWDKNISKEEYRDLIDNITDVPVIIDRIHTRKDKTTYMAEISAVKLVLEDKNYIYASARDITKKKQKELEIRDKLQKFIDTQNSIVILTDSKILKFSNKTFLDFFGYENLDDFSNSCSCICEKFIEQENFFHLGKVKENEASWIQSLLNLSGRQRIVSMLDKFSMPHAFSVSISNYEANDYVITFSDISDTIVEKQELKKEAIIDELTQLFNRVYFTKHIETILQTHKNNNMKTGVIFFDIDYFKKVNDTYGHDVGDYVLKSIAALVKKYTRDDDKVIRWGGEEFIIITEIDKKEYIKQIAENLRSVIEEYKFRDINSVTCSFGCALHDENKNILDTIKAADEKLYIAKESGRNRVEC